MLAAKDAALALWIVDSHLKQAIGVAAAWGFSFKTVLFVWEKCAPGAVPKISMGYYTRKQCELCLGFTRGSPKVRSHAVRQLIQEPRREHSRKPDEQYPRLEALFDGPRIELFARSRRPGWHVWGDQVTKFQPEEKKHG
jgi:N6-adenosine-specific RNA methylase IME4